jgi:hypothetical protein
VLLMNAYSVSLDFTKPSLFTRITLSSQIPLTMATTVNKTVRVAAAQMTSVNDLMTNFAMAYQKYFNAFLILF